MASGAPRPLQIEIVEDGEQRTLEYGGVLINDIPTLRVDNFPYGGTKDSGFGREGVRYAMDEMTEPKVLLMRGLSM